MSAADDLRFPPINPEPAPDPSPLDLSVLARVSTQETTTETPSKPRDRPPRTGPKEPRPEPPPRSRSRSTSKTTPPVSTPDDSEKITDYRPGILVKPLRDLYVTVGTLVLPFNQPVGTAFIQNAEPCAKALDNAAKTDKQIRRVLMLLVQGSVWGEIIIAHMPIMMALAVTLVPSVRSSLNAVQSEEDNSETVNPVSNGYMR
jgi:hypothetical protein